MGGDPLAHQPHHRRDAAHLPHHRGQDQRQAERKRDALILDLERKGGALASSLTLRDSLTRFVDYKQESGTIEPSTVRGYRAELALTAGMRRGEVCALRWGDVSDADHSVAVRRARGNAEGGFYVKEPKTSSSVRTIPLTRHTWELLASMRAKATRTLAPFGLSAADAYIPGTQEPESRPYNPTQLGKDFAAFCKMNGFKCTFHDLRNTAATMMIAKGIDVRTVASYLGHASVTMTLDTYADVDPDPDAKRAAVSKVEESFDVDFGDIFGAPAPEAKPAPALTFMVDQLEAMLAQVRAQERQFKLA